MSSTLRDFGDKFPYYVVGVNFNIDSHSESLIEKLKEDNSSKYSNSFISFFSMIMPVMKKKTKKTLNS